MPLILLLDLDDTLLNTNLPAFIPAYFQALSKELAPHIPPEKMFRALLSGTNLMNQSEDFTRTLREVFDADFYPQLEISPGTLDAEIENFYDTIFPTLQHLTSPNPEAKPFVEWAFAQGYRVAIATDLLLPGKAVYYRLRWAGLDPAQLELVTALEEFHFSKTHAAYYAETLGRLGWGDTPVLMVGNDLERDILPSKKLGLATYHVDIVGDSASTPNGGAVLRGTLSDLRVWLEALDLKSLMPSFHSIDSILATLTATPAALNGLLGNLSAEEWSRKTSASQWTMTELICHLRDTEREIHLNQLRLFLEKDEPFIPRPDTSVWASQRDYAHEDGRSALHEYNQVRAEVMEILRSIPETAWERKARHAIFGPTTFREVLGFMAEHDRLHIHQAWQLLKAAVSLNQPHD